MWIVTQRSELPCKNKRDNLFFQDSDTGPNLEPKFGLKILSAKNNVQDDTQNIHNAHMSTCTHMHHTCHGNADAGHGASGQRDRACVATGARSRAG